MSDVTPIVVVQQFESGATVDGSAPDGAYLGRYREFYQKWTECTVGGQMPNPDDNDGHRIKQISWNLPGVTDVSVYLVDDDGIEYLVESSADASGTLKWREEGILVIPSFGFKVVATGALTAKGRVLAVFGQGWGQPTFMNMGTRVLSENSVPPRQS